MHLIQNIQITATWLAKVNIDFETNLFRTPELMPDRHFIDIPDIENTLEQIALKRTELQKIAGIEPISIKELHNYGRIMYFDVDSTVVDGFPEVQSCMYIDGYDTPPPDTWIAMGSQLNKLGVFNKGSEIPHNWLVAWVPKSQYFYANEALLGACVDNFEWPKNENIAKEFAELKPVFQEPADIIYPKENINLEKRLTMLRAITKALDEHSSGQTYITSPLQAEKKSFFKLIWNWTAGLWKDK